MSQQVRCWSRHTRTYLCVSGGSWLVACLRAALSAGRGQGDRRGLLILLLKQQQQQPAGPGMTGRGAGRSSSTQTYEGTSHLTLTSEQAIVPPFIRQFWVPDHPSRPRGELDRLLPLHSDRCPDFEEPAKREKGCFGAIMTKKRKRRVGVCYQDHTDTPTRLSSAACSLAHTTAQPRTTDHHQSRRSMMHVTWSHRKYIGCVP